MSHVCRGHKWTDPNDANRTAILYCHSIGHLACPSERDTLTWLHSQIDDDRMESLPFGGSQARRITHE